MQPDKLPLTSADIRAQQLEKLRQLFPEAFTEGNKVDFEKLKLSLGEDIDTADERFGLHWAGKKNCFKIIQEPSIGALKPAPEESMDWDSTQNLFIEGDNLEVLKLLQKSYYGKVKMIYIDPPYNTGKEFIYPDKYQENLQTYLAYTGQVDEEGYKFSTNTETEGRFHSKWLNMMYPRLFLARNLLREDGVIFISIDDNEMDNLWKVCSEIYGEENYLGTLVIDKNRKNDARFLSIGHEYMLVFAKSRQYFIDKDIWFREPKEGIEKVKSFYKSLKRKYGKDVEKIQEEWRGYFKKMSNSSPIKKLGRYSKIDLQKGPYRDDGNISWPGGKGPKYEVIHPVTKKLCKVPNGGWRYSKLEKFWEEVENGRVVFGPDETTLPRQIRYLFESDGQVMRSVFFSYAQTATMDFGELMGSGIFENPKYWKDIERIMNLVQTENAIIMDFFGGSGTTAHATIELNKKDGGNRHYIIVQLPELTDKKSDAYKLGYGTISDIGKERIRRVIQKVDNEKEQLQIKLTEKKAKLEALKQEAVAQPQLFGASQKSPESEKLEAEISELEEKISNIEQTDLGFRVYKLDKSNFRVWDGSVESQPLAQQLRMAVDHIDPSSSEQDILYEILLKSGFELTVPIKKLILAGKKVYSIAGDALLICLERELTSELIREIAAREPARVVCLDSGFRNNDQLKTNAVQIMKSHGVNDFRTV